MSLELIRCDVPGPYANRLPGLKVPCAFSNAGFPSTAVAVTTMLFCDKLTLL